jgi:hypothetical protein
LRYMSRQFLLVHFRVTVRPNPQVVRPKRRSPHCRGVCAGVGPTRHPEQGNRACYDVPVWRGVPTASAHSCPQRLPDGGGSGSVRAILAGIGRMVGVTASQGLHVGDVPPHKDAPRRASSGHGSKARSAEHQGRRECLTLRRLARARPPRDQVPPRPPPRLRVPEPTCLPRSMRSRHPADPVSAASATVRQRHQCRICHPGLYASTFARFPSSPTRRGMSYRPGGR